MKKQTAVKWLFKTTGKTKICILVLIVLHTLMGFSSVVFAMLLRNVIDCASAIDKQGFFRYLCLLIGLVIMQIIFRTAVRTLEEYSRSSIENSLKSRLFDNILKKDYYSVTSLHSGEWINRLTSDTVVCSSGIVEILPESTGMLVKMFSALIMILTLEPKFAYIMVPGGIVLVFLTYSFRKFLKKLHKKVQEKDGILRIFLQERLSSLLIVRSFAAEEQTESEAAEKMSGHQKARMDKNRFSNVCNIGFSAAMNGMYLLGLGYCGYGIINAAVSYGTLTAVLQLINQVQSPFANITGYLPKFYAMTASAERLMEIESFADDCPDGTIDLPEIHRFYQNEFESVNFKNADFTYQNLDNAVVLKNINLSIKKGEYIAFTGQSGCGKSTLLKLLMCLYPLDSGERLLTDINGKSVNLTSSWHRLFAYVPQGNHLMCGTIREIISFSDKTEMYNQEKIETALKISCAQEFVSELEKGADTLLGERGQGLSEGQMQRIAVARAVFSDSPVLLLDESTSALDENTEKKLLENLQKMTDKTVLIVTHRPAALEICDKIVEITDNDVKIQVKAPQHS